MLTVEGHPIPIGAVAALGIVVGYVAGMFGIGGGFLITPLLVVVFRVPLPIAVGTGLCQIIGTSLVAFLRHRGVHQGEPRFDLLMLPGSVLGVELGARTLTALGRAGSAHFGGRSVPWVNVVVETSYAIMLGIVAFSYWSQGKRGIDVLQHLRPGPLTRVRLEPQIALPAVGLPHVSTILIAYLGLLLGFLSGLLGIGGGVALNPILIYGFGFPIRQAVGTGIIVLFATAIAGTFAYAMRGQVYLDMAIVMLLGATISAQFGALASRRMQGRTLGRIHAIVIVAAVVAVLWDLGSHVR